MLIIFGIFAVGGLGVVMRKLMFLKKVEMSPLLLAEVEQFKSWRTSDELF